MENPNSVELVEIDAILFNEGDRNYALYCSVLCDLPEPRRRASASSFEAKTRTTNISCQGVTGARELVRGQGHQGPNTNVSAAEVPTHFLRPTTTPLIRDIQDNELTAITTVSGNGDMDSAPGNSSEPAETIDEHFVDEGVPDDWSETTSIENFDDRCVEEGGRIYHDPSKYPLPRDEREQRRLAVLDMQWQVSYDGKLLLCPKEQFRRVLDIGTGTGFWAMDFADEHPEADVIGLDISRGILPVYVPPNCEFQIDDVEEQWTWSQKFDFIHGRMLGGCFRDFAYVLGQAFQHLEPGGWLEVKDINLTPRCDDGTLPRDSNLFAWAHELAEAAGRMGRPINLASQYGRMLVEAGFTNVEVVEHKWPTNQWAKDVKQNELGRLSQSSFADELETISGALLVHGLNLSHKEVAVRCTLVRREFNDPQIHAYFPVFTAFGMKPQR
ncbi:hypothetical protein VTK26DRAFT_7443 [Humicola hyalothermophila]